MSITPVKKLTVLLASAGAIATLSACGEAKIEVASDSSETIKQGAQLFYERCSGCHTLSSAASEGSAVKVSDVEHTDGPNLDQRAESKEQVLYAIRNGGFSGAIMPQNIVVGEEADAVAEYVAEYSGTLREAPQSP